jgi:formamidopyrimidine-DNA glycosylase
MPELPEVETIRRDLEKRICGLTIEEVTIFDPRVVVQPKAFVKNLLGKTIVNVSRRAKLLILSLGDHAYWVVHLKMTGQLVLGKNLKAQGCKETKVVMRLSNGEYLNYNDQRLFGRLIFVKNLKDVPFLKKVGPEPLNGAWNVSILKEALSKRTTPIKVLLLNQEFVAGIGNIYASEILFQAKINPKKSSRKLIESEISALYQSTRSVLHEAIRFRGTSMRNYRDSSGEKGLFMKRIKVYGRDKEPCCVCQTTIQRIVQGQRSTFYCPQCQPLKHSQNRNFKNYETKS